MAGIASRQMSLCDLIWTQNRTCICECKCSCSEFTSSCKHSCAYRAILLTLHAASNEDGEIIPVQSSAKFFLSVAPLGYSQSKSSPSKSLSRRYWATLYTKVRRLYRLLLISLNFRVPKDQPPVGWRGDVCYHMRIVYLTFSTFLHGH